MTVAIPPAGGADTAGIAGSYTDTITQGDPFLTGDHPAIVTTDEPVGASTTIAARTPVALSSGVLVAATQGTPAIGITVVDVATTSGQTGLKTPIYRQGCFNPDMINWPASYDTDEKKRTAFAGAASPTSIILRAPRTMNPAAPI